MLKLAELLCLNHIQVTFLNTEHIQTRFKNCTDNETYFRKYPNFRFQTVPDGLPEGNPRNGDQVQNQLESMEASAVPIFREMVRTGVCDPVWGDPMSCIIADGVFTFATGIAEENDVPLLYFDTLSPCGFWTYMCLPKLIEAGEVPVGDDNLDEIITNAPGMEGIIRRRDLPSFCRTQDLSDRTMQRALKETKHIPLAQGLIFNTFYQLDAPVLSQILKISPKIYAIGPLHALLNTRLSTETTSNSIWKEDKTCISWLDEQPVRSVIYVSIGSLAVMTKEQLLEIWHGLVNSGSRFLWVRRPGSILGLDSDLEVPLELARGTEERGYIVSWAPQEECLAHPAIGGFLTHSGWNSTLESIVAGKPMICWPHLVDQQVNSRYVEKVWKIGLDMKDTCDRVVIEKMIRELMELKKDEFSQKVEEMAKLAKASVSEGGSSLADLNRLIEDIKLMKIPTTRN
ncbi:UDP-glucuronosyl and UDP-glucosyl transferase [Handroanthus impetiginosus]|uniref:UDP-glucuronosyl and UDP-glucosyl transferase n=1 Tax=Handroanthus impetiginosus TaxID=429701 RepID=A0A2G9FWD5_9LAMI|nr:UDP-glucuronosyl and UDP-glucosyl transferase [Handroanthus impetiginosus]